MEHYYVSGEPRILIKGVLEVRHGHKAPRKFRPEATPANFDVISIFSKVVTTYKQQLVS